MTFDVFEAVKFTCQVTYFFFSDDDMDNFCNNDSTDEENEEVLRDNLRTDMADWVIENLITTNVFY